MSSSASCPNMPFVSMISGPQEPHGSVNDYLSLFNITMVRGQKTSKEFTLNNHLDELLYSMNQEDCDIS